MKCWCWSTTVSEGLTQTSVLLAVERNVVFTHCENESVTPSKISSSDTRRFQPPIPPVRVHVENLSLLFRGSIIYNVVDTSSTGVGINEGGVMVGVHDEDGTQVTVRSFLLR